MKKIYQQGKAVLFLSALMLPSLALAQPGKEPEKTRPADFMEAIRQAEIVRKNLFEDPLSGIVMNRTVTVQGHEFYRFFSNRWRELGEDNPFTLTIFERPSARWGSEIWVEYRGQRMYHAFLAPARSSTKKASEQAVDIVMENVNKSEIARLLTNNPDLGPEEF